MAATLTLEALERIAALVKKRIGVTLEAGKLQRMRRKIEGVMHKHGYEDFHAFYHALRFKHDEALIQELLNAVTINETYFWREHEQFEICCQKLLPEYVAQKGADEKIRFLVAPCSSGEELYSIMIALSEEKTILERTPVEMVGIDIDSSMIEKAKRGLYTRRSVERLPAHLQQKYFTQVGDYYRILPEFTEVATFLVANIFDETLPDRLGQFDFLFSRNMLIYFNHEEKRRCFDQLYKLLKPGGYLFLGHADSNGIDKTRFQPLGLGSPIYRKV